MASDLPQRQIKPRKRIDDGTRRNHAFSLLHNPSEILKEPVDLQRRCGVGDRCRRRVLTHKQVKVSNKSHLRTVSHIHSSESYLPGCWLPGRGWTGAKDQLGQTRGPEVSLAAALVPCGSGATGGQI